MLPAILVFAAAAFPQSVGTFTTVPGRIHGMTTGAQGNLLYCTEQREVGKINLQKQVAILADGTTGPFTNALRGVRQLSNGDLAVIDAVGEIYRLPGGIAPAVKVYSDLYMISDPTDLLIDGGGNFVTVSQSPSSGFKAINWINSTGMNWAYYLVKHQPCAVTQDLLTGSLIIADEAGGGTLRIVSATDDSHPTILLDGSTGFGFTAAANDGDMAVEANGNILIIAAGKLFRHDRSTGLTSVVLSGLGDLHAISIATSSGDLPSASGYSAYLAQGTGPTTILEVPNVVGPAAPTGPSLGTVPSRGLAVNVLFGMNVFEMARDTSSSSLLVGGDLWGLNPSVKRLNLNNLQLSTVATDVQGIQSRVMGISVGQDNAIYIGTTDGYIQRIVENPVSVSTLFSDPTNAIQIAEDMTRDRNGAFWVASRNGWGTGYVTKIENGFLTNLVSTVETRGVLGDPITGKLAFSEWINIGFNGRVNLFNTTSSSIEPIVGLEGVNYSNAGVWADGDLCEDVFGNIYTCSEDDFSIYRFERATGKLVRIAAGYLNHPAGLVIAKSRPASGSTTGWSLYVVEYNTLWEIPSVAAPAPVAFDPGKPGVGKALGFFPPGTSTLRAITKDPAGNGFYVTTSTGTVERMSMSGQRTQVAGAGQGVGGDLIGIASRSNGHLVVATRTGKVYEIDPNNNYVGSLIFTNPGFLLSDVRSIAVDGNDKILLGDQPAASPEAGKLYRIESGQAQLVSFTHRGYRAAEDPLSGDWFVPQIGSAIDGGGEVLRVNAFASPATSGHYRGSNFFTLPVGGFDGGIAFTAEGDFYIALASTGSVVKVDRASGNLTTFAANYTSPVGVSIAPGTPGIAGPQGSSLFVLDDNAIYEIGIAGTTPPPPPVNQPNQGAGADLRVTGALQLGGATPIQVASPADANKIYLVFASLSGKLPGFPINTFGDPTDTRFIPNNPDYVWQYINSPQIMPDFYGVLDGNGNGSPLMALVLPNDPGLLLGQFLDFAWIAFDFSAPNGIGTIGGTAQIYLGN